MKKITILVLTLAIILVSEGAFSQKRIFAGIKLGVNNSDIYNNANDSAYIRNTYAGGLSFMLTFKGRSKIRRSSLLFDVTYMPMGYRIDNADFKINYISLAIKPRYYFGILGKLKSGLFFDGGPYFSNIISASNFGYVGGKSVFDSNTKDLYKTNDYGITLGGGWSLSGVVSIEYNFILGLSPILKFSESNIMNRSHSLFVRFAIPYKL